MHRAVFRESSFHEPLCGEKDLGCGVSAYRRAESSEGGIIGSWAVHGVDSPRFGVIHSAASAKSARAYKKAFQGLANQGVFG
jgi:hypothetical protein